MREASSRPEKNSGGRDHFFDLRGAPRLVDQETAVRALLDGDLDGLVAQRAFAVAVRAELELEVFAVGLAGDVDCTGERIDTDFLFVWHAAGIALRSQAAKLGAEF